MDKIQTLFDEVLQRKIIKKIVFSKPNTKEILKMHVTLFQKLEQTMVQFAQYTSDNKVFHKNVAVEDAAKQMVVLLQSTFSQCNILTTNGEAQIKISKNGTYHLQNKIKMEQEAVVIASHNREKRKFLSDKNGPAFLELVGVCDKNGRVYDKMQFKFKQINRFLELIDDSYPTLPTHGTLSIADLCCGKSYLTFAAHYYFTQIKNRTVNMVGIDLKADVIEHCSNIVEKLQLQGITFIYGDVFAYQADTEKIDLVISLHACDTATDFVLAGAIKQNADVILSSPCCQHELATQLRTNLVPSILDFPILRQKFCELATDGLRAKALDVLCYDVQIVEFIDPENTPKNLMLRAVKRKTKDSADAQQEKIKKYQQECACLGVTPTLGKLLNILP